MNWEDVGEGIILDFSHGQTDLLNKETVEVARALGWTEGAFPALEDEDYEGWGFEADTAIDWLGSKDPLYAAWGYDDNCLRRDLPWIEVVSMQGDEAVEALHRLSLDGEDGLVAYLRQWDFYEETATARLMMGLYVHDLDEEFRYLHHHYRRIGTHEDTWQVIYNEYLPSVTLYRKVG